MSSQKTQKTEKKGGGGKGEKKVVDPEQPSKQVVVHFYWRQEIATAIKGNKLHFFWMLRSDSDSPDVILYGWLGSKHQLTN